jgi:hypothetical protein
MATLSVRDPSSTLSIAKDQPERTDVGCSVRTALDVARLKRRGDPIARSASGNSDHEARE